MTKRKTPVVVRIGYTASAVLFALALAGVAFIAGYSIAFSKVADVYAETSVLKAKAQVTRTLDAPGLSGGHRSSGDNR